MATVELKHKLRNPIDMSNWITIWTAKLDPKKTGEEQLIEVTPSPKFKLPTNFKIPADQIYGSNDPQNPIKISSDALSITSNDLPDIPTTKIENVEPDNGNFQNIFLNKQGKWILITTGNRLNISNDTIIDTITNTTTERTIISHADIPLSENILNHYVTRNLGTTANPNFEKDANNNYKIYNKVTNAANYTTGNDNSENWSYKNLAGDYGPTTGAMGTDPPTDPNGVHVYVTSGGTVYHEAKNTTFYVPKIKLDAAGHVVSAENVRLTIPKNDLNTNGYVSASSAEARVWGTDSNKKTGWRTLETKQAYITKATPTTPTIALGGTSTRNPIYVDTANKTLCIQSIKVLDTATGVVKVDVGTPTKAILISGNS